jgi:hypothetical protein
MRTDKVSCDSLRLPEFAFLVRVDFDNFVPCSALERFQVRGYNLAFCTEGSRSVKFTDSDVE